MMVAIAAVIRACTDMTIFFSFAFERLARYDNSASTISVVHCL
jgi:hypothetical protein